MLGTTVHGQYRLQKTITVTAGTPINVNCAAPAGPSCTNSNTASTQPVYVSKVIITMLHGGTSVGYVMAGIYGHVPAASASVDLTTELYPASPSAPGGTYSDSSPVAAASIDVNALWIDGAHSGDTIQVSWVK